MGETHVIHPDFKIPLHLKTCETRKQVTCPQNTMMEQAYVNNYRYFHAQSEKMEGRKESLVPRNFGIQLGKIC